MRDELERLAEGIGELYAAARHDYAMASWDDIGLHGVPIKHWREAYVEGCKDMAGKVASALDEAEREVFVVAVREALDRHEKLLAAS